MKRISRVKGGILTQIMVKNSRSTIPQVDENKKQYTKYNVKRDYLSRKFQHITGQTIKKILHVVDNNILQKLPIL